MGVIEDVCDRVVMMANGQIVADDTVTALLSGTDRDGIRVVSADIDEAVVATLRERFDVRGVETVSARARARRERLGRRRGRRRG